MPGSIRDGILPIEQMCSVSTALGEKTLISSPLGPGVNDAHVHGILCTNPCY